MSVRTIQGKSKLSSGIFLVNPQPESKLFWEIFWANPKPKPIVLIGNSCESVSPRVLVSISSSGLVSSYSASWVYESTNTIKFPKCRAFCSSFLSNWLSDSSLGLLSDIISRKWRFDVRSSLKLFKNAVPNLNCDRLNQSLDIIVRKETMWIGSNWLPNTISTLVERHSQLTALVRILQGLITKEIGPCTILSATSVETNMFLSYHIHLVAVGLCKCLAKRKQYKMLGFSLKIITIPGIPTRLTASHL